MKIRVSLLIVAAAIASAAHATTISLPLTDGSANAVDLGFFAGGAIVTITVTGNGDLVDSSLQVNPDGSLFAAATGSYTYANASATTYPTTFGGDGTNHFSGGGLNYDTTGSGFGFAGKMTTDTTDPAAIRDGAVVGTFSATPARADWFLVGNSDTITIPVGGDHIYLAVNDSVNSDNHGTYSVVYSVSSASATPEPSSLSLAGLSAAFIFGAARRRRRA